MSSLVVYWQVPYNLYEINNKQQLQPTHVYKLFSSVKYNGNWLLSLPTLEVALFPNEKVPRQIFDTLMPQFGPNQLYSTDGFTFSSDIIITVLEKVSG